MELSLHDVDFSSIDPSYLAACSLCLSFKLLEGPVWSRQLEFYSTYTVETLASGMRKLACLVLKSQESDYKYKAVTKKYSISKFMRISLLPELSGSFIKSFAFSGLALYETFWERHFKINLKLFYFFRFETFVKLLFVVSSLLFFFK